MSRIASPTLLENCKAKMTQLQSSAEQKPKKSTNWRTYLNAEFALLTKSP